MRYHILEDLTFLMIDISLGGNQPHQLSPTYAVHRTAYAIAYIVPNRTWYLLVVLVVLTRVRQSSVTSMCKCYVTFDVRLGDSGAFRIMNYRALGSWKPQRPQLCRYRIIELVTRRRRSPRYGYLNWA